MLKMSRLFGLLTGSDISGSAVNVVFVMELFGADILVPADYLLLVPWLVFNCHHTLLEVAVPLTLVDVIDYRVGFHTTLLPEGKLPAELAAIPSLLASAENHRDNFLMLVWYDYARLAGAIVFDRNEEGELVKESRLFQSKDILGQIQLQPRYPTRDGVRELLRNRSPELLRLCPDL
jgi:hypothetical protein